MTQNPELIQITVELTNTEIDYLRRYVAADGFVTDDHTPTPHCPNAILHRLHDALPEPPDPDEALAEALYDKFLAILQSPSYMRFTKDSEMGKMRRAEMRELAKVVRDHDAAIKGTP